MTVYLKDPEQETIFDGKVLDKLQNFKKISSGASDKGLEIQLQIDPKTVESIKQRAVRQAVDTIRNRVDQFGVAEPDVVITRRRPNLRSIAGSCRGYQSSYRHHQTNSPTGIQTGGRKR